VTLATIDDQVGAELGYGERPVHRKQLYQLNVPVHLDLMLKSVRREGDSLVATLTNDLTDAPVEIEADQVVVERGTYPLDEVYVQAGAAPAFRSKRGRRLPPVSSRRRR
jgi:hypothetical protein